MAKTHEFEMIQQSLYKTKGVVCGFVLTVNLNKYNCFQDSYDQIYEEVYSVLEKRLHEYNFKRLELTNNYKRGVWTADIYLGKYFEGVL